MAKLPRTSQSRGSTLIIVIGLLTILSGVAIAFHRIGLIERGSAHADLLNAHAQMVAEAGIQEAIARLRQDFFDGRINRSAWSDQDDNGNGHPDYRAPDWYFMGEDSNRNFIDDEGEDQNGNGQVDRLACPIDTAPSPSYPTSEGSGVSRILESGQLTAVTKLRIRDPQGMINLNNNYHAFYILLNNLGRVLETQQGRDPIAPIQYEEHTGGQAIIAYRDQALGGQFASKSQIQEILTRPTDFDLLDPYLTANSWRDDKAVMGRLVAEDHLAWTNLSRAPYDTTSQAFLKAHEPADLVHVPRYPINVNTAPKEVLTALILTVRAFAPVATNGGWLDNGEVNLNPRENDSDDYLEWDKNYHLALKKYAPTEVEAEAWAQAILNHRHGDEVDEDESANITGSEDTNDNGLLDTGPFTSFQDLTHLFLDVLELEDGSEIYDGDFLRAALVPYAQSIRTNPNYVATARVNDVINDDSIKQRAVYLCDKGHVEVPVPELTLRSHGFFEITSQGSLIDRQGVVQSQREISCVVQIFDHVEHRTQADFLSMPTDASWTADQTPPVEFWDNLDVRRKLGGALTGPENIFDNRDGSPRPEVEKADPYEGGLELASLTDPVDDDRLLFQATFQTSGNADYPNIEATPGSNQSRGGGPGVLHIENQKVSGLETHLASDLVHEGIYHNAWRRGRRTSFDNSDYQLMHPKEGSLELWWKPASLYFGGEIFTAIMPADPTIESAQGRSTEGIVMRIYVGYLPGKRAEDKDAYTYMGANNNQYIPERWHRNAYWENDPEENLLAIPVLVAERMYYTAVIGADDNRLHGRDTEFEGRGNSGPFAGETVNLKQSRQIRMILIQKWLPPQMWHHIQMTWDEDELVFSVDDSRAAQESNGSSLAENIDYRTASQSNEGGKREEKKGNDDEEGGEAEPEQSLTPSIVIPFWNQEEMSRPEIHIGGITKVEMDERTHTGRPLLPAVGFAFTPLDPAKLPPDDPYVVNPSDRLVYGNPGQPVEWSNDATLSDLRIYSSSNVKPNLHRYPTRSEADPPDTPIATYQNQFSLPTNALAVGQVCWDEYVPYWDPNIRTDGDSNLSKGRYLTPGNRPDIVIEVSSTGEAIRLDEDYIQATLGLTKEAAERTVEGGAVPVPIQAGPGQRIQYKALFRNPEDESAPDRPDPLQITPILESVSIYYTIPTKYFGWDANRELQNYGSMEDRFSRTVR